MMELADDGGEFIFDQLENAVLSKMNIALDEWEAAGSSASGASRASFHNPG